jgi:hypothetical protein
VFSPREPCSSTTRTCCPAARCRPRPSSAGSQRRFLQVGCILPPKPVRSHREAGGSGRSRRRSSIGRIVVGLALKAGRGSWWRLMPPPSKPRRSRSARHLIVTWTAQAGSPARGRSSNLALAGGQIAKLAGDGGPARTRRPGERHAARPTPAGRERLLPHSSSSPLATQLALEPCPRRAG